MGAYRHSVRGIALLTLAVVAAGCLCLAMAQTAGSSPVWNEFAGRSMLPTADKVQSHRVASAPAAEQGTCVSRLQRVVKAEFVPAGIETHLIPLRDWTLPVCNRPADRYPCGNCFLVRQERGNDMVQVEEGLGLVIVEVRHVDGSRLAPKGANLADYAVSAVPDWLAPTMKPKGEVYPLTDLGSAVATWLTSDVPEADDPTQLTFGMCYAYSDGSFLRYEIRAWKKISARAFDPPPPYTFGVAACP